MKRTDLERRERELRRTVKQSTVLSRKTDAKTGASGVGEYIEKLFSLFRYDDQEIFNATDDIDILEVLEDMKDDQPEKQWDNILRKAIKKTKIANKEKAFEELSSLLHS